ncbi:PPE domain-containing protein [Nocardia macrotermitis]|uniref:PPE domain-containing protein n=1 Tax=Nocardia macrotermitis TaxID=2585198 RepID=A0A7K0DDR3_9NOCA|nr:PPE domain-containing protein [Nocardia macrotermitis]MQY23847.1 hypothetical protein [Nocardia macrotermitis]
MLPFDFFAITAQAIIGQLLIGPGTASIHATAEAYAAIAAQLHAAAAGTDGSMTQMGETWRGPSSDTAQTAFRINANTLREQADVALTTSSLLIQAEVTYDAACQAMAVVQAELIEFEARQTAVALAGCSGIPTAPLLLLMETESIAILAAAVGVMVGYAGALEPVLAGLPTPVVGQPVVTNPAGPELTSMTTVEYLNSSTVGDVVTRSLRSVTPGSSSLRTLGDGSSSTHESTTSTPTNTEATDPNNLTNDPSSPTDTSQPTNSPVDPSRYTDSTNGYDGNSANHSGLHGTTRTSPTLSALHGGVGSSVALGMTRGGLGSLAGASTGYRMPANWKSGGRAFGASLAEAETPVSRPLAPRGATAPEARMRRRRRDEEETRASRVITPGEEQEVPVLESVPLVGVIEYRDDDHHDEYHE